MRQLPIIPYKGNEYYVDFRLGEMRRVTDAKPIKFTALKEPKDSEIKKQLRGMRFLHWYQEYIPGVDD